MKAPFPLGPVAQLSTGKRCLGPTDFRKSHWVVCRLGLHFLRDGRRRHAHHSAFVHEMNSLAEMELHTLTSV